MLLEHSLYKEVIAGASAGVTGTVLGFPLDRYELSQKSPLSFDQSAQCSTCVRSTASKPECRHT